MRDKLCIRVVDRTTRTAIQLNRPGRNSSLPGQRHKNSTEYSVTHPPLSIFITAQESTSSFIFSQCVTNLSVDQILPWKQADIKDDPERFFLRLLRLASSCRACTALIDSPVEVFTVSLQLASSKTKKKTLNTCSINCKIF